MRGLTFFIQLVFLREIICNEQMEARDKDLRENQEKAARTSIVTYNKAEMTINQIENEKKRLEELCKCDIEHLPAVGAFLLSYNKANHLKANNLDIKNSKEVGAEDDVVSIFENDTASRKMPNDPGFSSQWALSNLDNNADINARNGWDEYLSDTIGGSQNGPEVVIAVIDTGVDYTHPDLKDMMWTNPRETPGNGKDDDNNGIIDDVYGADFTSSNRGDPIDRRGHGTHCAGVIAAKEDNNIGIAGVTSFSQGKIKIMAVKGLGDWGSGTYSGLLKSLNYAILQGAKISSNSWGSRRSVSYETAQLWKNVLRNNRDHLFIAAAGNSGRLINKFYKPMTCGLNEPNLLCVASSTQYDKMSSFSNYGQHFVHVFAPGSSIYSTYPNNRYKTLDGTSMACPHASGLAALIMTVRSDLKGHQVKDMIVANVQNKTSYKHLVTSGGLIDVANTIKAVKTKATTTAQSTTITTSTTTQSTTTVQSTKTTTSTTTQSTTTTLSTTTPTTTVPRTTTSSVSYEQHENKVCKWPSGKSGDTYDSLAAAENGCTSSSQCTMFYKVTENLFYTCPLGSTITSSDGLTLYTTKEDRITELEVIRLIVTLVVAALVVLMLIYCCYVFNKKKNRTDSNVAQNSKEQNNPTILKPSATLPHQKLSSTTPLNQPTGVFRKFSPAIMHIPDVFRKFSPAIMHIPEENLAPPSALNLSPLFESFNQLFDHDN